MPAARTILPELVESALPSVAPLLYRYSLLFTAAARTPELPPIAAHLPMPDNVEEVLDLVNN